MTSVDPELWRDNIVHWLTPFPVDRWRRRGWSTMATHRIARERAQLEPRPETSAARAAEQRAAAAFATWAHLHDVGLARDGDEDDLVSNVLAHDLAANAG